MRALRLPSLLEEFAEAVDGLEHGSGAGVGIDGAEDPGVAMIAGDDPVVFLRRVGSFDDADDVPDGAQCGVLLEVHVDGDLVCAAEVIGEGKRSLPCRAETRARRGT